MTSYGEIFNIRVPPPKQAIIDEYKTLVKDRLHSDLCFVTTMLIESFVKAHRETPEPTFIQLVKQDITIQQNCTNIYGSNLKRARRLMPKEHLSPIQLPKCELCEAPATRRYLFPFHGYMDLCIQHKGNARGSLGYRDLTKPNIPVNDRTLTPTFPLQQEPKEKIQKDFSLWTRVKQLLTKLVKYIYRK